MTHPMEGDFVSTATSLRFPRWKQVGIAFMVFLCGLLFSFRIFKSKEIDCETLLDLYLYRPESTWDRKQYVERMWTENKCSSTVRCTRLQHLAKPHNYSSLLEHIMIVLDCNNDFIVNVSLLDNTTTKDYSATSNVSEHSVPPDSSFSSIIGTDVLYQAINTSRSNNISIHADKNGKIYNYRSMDNASWNHVGQKRFVYLIQGASYFRESRFNKSSNRDVIWLTFRDRKNSDIFLPRSTWATGRNALLDLSLLWASKNGGKGYQYYIFLDADMLRMIEGENPWEDFENWLIEDLPAIGYITATSPWIPRTGKVTNHIFNVDGNLNAFHYSCLGSVLPYDSSTDYWSWYNSQMFVNLMVAAMFANQRLGYNRINVNWSRNEHSGYKLRDHDWSNCKKHLLGAFIDDDAIAGMMVASCGFVESNGLCDFKKCNFTYESEVTTPVSEVWIRDKMNATHNFTVQRLEFLQKHASFLSSLRAGRDFTPIKMDSARCRMDSGIAFCLHGLVGSRNVSSALSANVLDVLGDTDLYVTTADRDILNTYFGNFSSKARIRGVSYENQSEGSLVDFFNDHAPWWHRFGHCKGPSCGNWLGGLPQQPRTGAIQLREAYECLSLVRRGEAIRGHNYKYVIYSRIDIMWVSKIAIKLPDHGCIIPCEANDYGGYCDHISFCSRAASEVVLRGRLIPPDHSYNNAEGHLKYSLLRSGVSVQRVGMDKVKFFRSCRIKNSTNLVMQGTSVCVYSSLFNMYGKENQLRLIEKEYNK